MMHKYRKISVMAAMLSIYCGGNAWAAPAVGSPQEDIQTDFSVEQEKAEIKTELPASDAKSDDVRFHLKAIEIETDAKLRNNNAGLSLITDMYKDTEVNIDDLRLALNEVTTFFRINDYPAATAYLPPQTAEDGIVRIGVEVGRYGEVTIENSSHLKTNAIKRLIKGLHRGEIIRGKNLETAVYNVIGLGGVKAGAVLRPGEKQGVTDIVIKVEDGDRDSYVTYSENYGSKSSGPYRYGVVADWYDLSGNGDHLSANVSLSNKKQHNYGIRYDIPIGRSSTRLGVGVSSTDYELGSHLSSLGATGKANTYSLYGTTPIVHTGNTGVNVNYGWDHRDMKDEMRSVGYSVEKHSNAFHIGIDGFQRYGNAYVSYGITGYMGNLTGDSARIAGIPLEVEPEGYFSKGVFNAFVTKPIHKNWDFQVKFQGQIAGANLDSSEKMYLGGASGVRAYPQGEGSGDEGYQATAELRYHTPVPGLLLSTYFDIGHVKYMHDGTIPGGTTLKGWGVGLTWARPGDFFARLDYARRIGLANNATDQAKAKQRMWLQLGKIW